MKLTMILAPLAVLVGVTAVTIPSRGKEPTQADLDRAKAQCNLLAPARRQVCLKAIADPKNHGHIVLVYPGSEEMAVEIAGAAAPALAAGTGGANEDGGRKDVGAGTEGALQRRSEYEHAGGHPVHDNGDFEDVVGTRLHDNGKLKQRRSENGYDGGHPVHDNGDFEDVAGTRLHNNGKLKQRSENEHAGGRPVHDNGDFEELAGTHLWDNRDSKHQSKEEAHNIGLGFWADWPWIKREQDDGDAVEPRSEEGHGGSHPVHDNGDFDDVAGTHLWDNGDSKQESEKEHYIDIGDLANWPSIKHVEDDVDGLTAIENDDVAAAPDAGSDNGSLYLKRKKLPNASPDDDARTMVPEAQFDREYLEPTQHAKRNIEVTAAEDGTIDLAIPVPVALPADASPAPTAAPTPTTFATATRTTTPQRIPGGAITIDDTISVAPTTTYPVQRTLSTATLANGTEVRIEQTESRAHDVHVEETARAPGAGEEDTVVVHVRVLVEHVRDRVVAGLRRWVGGNDVQGGWVGEGLVVKGLEGRRGGEVGVVKRGEGAGKGEGEESMRWAGVPTTDEVGRQWACSCKWYGCFCGNQDAGWV